MPSGENALSTLVYMKILEMTPKRYDGWMRVLTLGTVDRIKAEIAARWIESNDKVLEIGCGTGSLAARMEKRGARVTGIDISEKMLAEARENAPNARFHHLTALEIDRFQGRGFNKIVATLSLSELTVDELDLLINMVRKILQPGGLFIVADEIRPQKTWQRILAALVRRPISMITFLLTQQTTHALVDFEKKTGANDLQPIRRQEFLLGSMALFVCKKGQP